jgi:hypothetical protein
MSRNGLLMAVHKGTGHFSHDLPEPLEDMDDIKAHEE